MFGLQEEILLSTDGAHAWYAFLYSFPSGILVNHIVVALVLILSSDI
jgi:hypothetical protein